MLTLSSALAGTPVANRRFGGIPPGLTRKFLGPPRSGWASSTLSRSIRSLRSSRLFLLAAFFKFCPRFATVAPLRRCLSHGERLGAPSCVARSRVHYHSRRRPQRIRSAEQSRLSGGDGQAGRQLTAECITLPAPDSSDGPRAREEEYWRRGCRIGHKSPSPASYEME